MNRSGDDCRRRVAAWWACAAALIFLLATASVLDAQEPGASAGATAVDDVAAAADTGAKPKDGVISGVLVNAADGEPVAGAVVTLRVGDKLEKAESDGSGGFRFENVPATEYYQLWARHENLVTKRVPVKRVDAGDGTALTFEPLRLEMTPGRQVRIAVTSRATGEPVAGATVKFGYPDRRTETSDEAGVVEVRGLGAEPYDVTIEAQEFARDWSEIDLSKEDAVVERDVALLPGGEVRGVVVDEQGQPVADAEVYYRESDGIGFHGDEFRTDENGRFRHRFLPLNVPIEVSVAKDDFENARQDVSLTKDQREREVTVKLARRPKGGSATGIVRDAEGRPVVGAQVANYGSRSSEERVTTTDGEGRFVLHDLFAGYAGVDVRVSAAGFAPQRVPVEPGTDEAPTEVEITLQPGHTLQGRIVNEAGEPLGGTYVMARSGEYRMGMESVQADERGEFAFESLPADVHFDFSHPDYPHTQARPYPLDGDERVTITLEDPGVIQGQVVDAATKEPVRQFRIRLGMSRQRQPGDVGGGYRMEWMQPGVTFQDDDGKFAIEPLAAGAAVELVVEAEGYERAVVARAVAAKRAVAEDLSIALATKMDVEPCTLAVMFLDAAGDPIPNVELRLIVSTERPTGPDDNAYNWALIDSGQLANKSYVEQYLPGVTNAEGKFKFKDLTVGKFLQLVYWREGVPKNRSLQFNETSVGQSQAAVIEVPRPACVRGTVDRAQFPDAGQVRISGDAQAFLSFEADLAADQSTFEIRDLPPGEYWISVVSKPIPHTENGHQMYRISPLASQRMTLEAGDELEVKFDEPDPPR